MFLRWMIPWLVLKGTLGTFFDVNVSETSVLIKEQLIVLCESAFVC